MKYPEVLKRIQGDLLGVICDQASYQSIDTIARATIHVLGLQITSTGSVVAVAPDPVVMAPEPPRHYGSRRRRR